jgi:hypothetical protein
MKAKSRLLVAHSESNHMVQTMDDKLADLLFIFYPTRIDRIRLTSTIGTCNLPHKYHVCAQRRSNLSG